MITPEQIRDMFETFAVIFHEVGDIDNAHKAETCADNVQVYIRPKYEKIKEVMSILYETPDGEMVERDNALAFAEYIYISSVLDIVDFEMLKDVRTAIAKNSKLINTDAIAIFLEVFGHVQ